MRGEREGAEMYRDERKRKKEEVQERTRHGEGGENKR